MSEDKFFNKSFFQLLLVQCLGSTISLFIAVVAAIFIGNQIQELRQLSESVNATLQTMLKIVEVGPEGITDVAKSIQDSAEKTGISVGDGSSIVVDKVGDSGVGLVDKLGSALQKYNASKPSE